MKRWKGSKRSWEKRNHSQNILHKKRVYFKFFLKKRERKNALPQPHSKIAGGELADIDLLQEEKTGVEFTSAGLSGNCFYPISLADTVIHFCHNPKIYVW